VAKAANPPEIQAQLREVNVFIIKKIIVGRIFCQDSRISMGRKLIFLLSLSTKCEKGLFLFL